MNELVFISGLFPDEIRNHIISSCSRNLQFAADALQWSILKGLCDLNNEIQVVNMPFIGGFPTLSTILRVPSFQFNKEQKMHCNNLGYLNVNLIKNYFIENKLYRYLSEYVQSKPKEADIVLIIYSAFIPFLRAGLRLKKEHSNIKIILFLADLPEFTNIPKNILRKKLVLNQIKIANNLIEKVDGHIFISSYMQEKLSSCKPFVTIEGIYDNSINRGSSDSIEKNKILLYSGNLAERYGIKKLIDAFLMIADPNLRLCVCGSGDSESYIKQKALVDDRIVFFGNIDRPKVLSLQAKSFLLINPRGADGVYTKYSFPSKVMEYLASGTPTLLCELPGIPTEYYDYCFSIKNNEKETLKEKIEEILTFPPKFLRQLGENAKRFIYESKNPQKQCSKIMDLINRLYT